MPVVSNIVAQGDTAYAELARVIRADETVFDTQYQSVRQQLPEGVRSLLPERPSKAELRRSVARISQVLGPAAARALVPAIEDALSDADPITAIDFLRMLYWSIPESPRAIRILSNYVASPSPQKFLLGMNTASQVWGAAPQLAPLMARWLRLSDQAGEAALALGAMGSVSDFAVDDVAQVAEFGVAGDPPTFKPAMGYPPEIDPAADNRCDAIRALGQIGATNDRVFKAFEKALVHPDQRLRCFAADGIGFLGAKSLPMLPYFLEHLDASCRLVLRHQIEAISRMGPGAKAAVPVLLKYCDKAAVESVPDLPPPNRAIRWDGEPMHLPFGAAWALAQVDIEKARSKVDLLAAALMFMVPEREVANLGPLKDELLRAAETLLKTEPGTPFSQNLAMNMLRIDREFPPAKRKLEDLLSARNPMDRSWAAYAHFQAFGDTNRAIAVLGQVLGESQIQSWRFALDRIARMGESARALSSQIRPLLRHSDFGVRHGAGQALRAIDPQAMPPVEEN